MTFFDVFIIGVGLSMDAFAVSVCKGLAMKKAGLKSMCIAGAWFGLFQAAMPLIGYFLGLTISSIIEKYSGIIAFVLLVLIGGNMIREALKKEDEDEVTSDMSFKTMLAAAVATSIDALTVGVSFSAYKISIFISVLIIGCTTFAISAAGVKIGSIFGDRFEKKAEIAGGTILIVMGLKFLLG